MRKSRGNERANDRGNERGTALLELSILAPALLFISMVALDAGMIVRSYFVLAQSVREAVRQGGSIAYLEPGVYHLLATSASNWNCNNPATCPSQQTKLLTTTRDVFLLQSQVLDIDIPNTTITSTFDAGQHTLQMRIQTKYKGLFPPFAGLSVAATATGPYK